MRTPVFYPGDAKCDTLFASDSAFMFRDKQFKEGPIEFLEGHMSNAWPDMLFKKKLAVELTKLAPPTVNRFGQVSGNGIRSNFYGLMHCNGYPMLPSTFPMANNELAREAKGLSNRFVQPWHQLALRLIVKLSAQNLEPVPLKLKEGSSSMLPFMEKRMPQKIELATFAMSKARQSAEWMLKGDYISPWKENFCGGAYGTVYRRQSSDSINLEKGKWIAKDRPVADLEYAITGGAQGVYKPASKVLEGTVDFRVPEGFFRERNRTAQGGPLGMNAVLMPGAQAIREKLYHRYEYTFHHTTRESLQADLREWKMVIPADVSNHDQFWPTFTLETIMGGLSDAGFEDWWLKLYRVKSSLPFYVTDVGPGLGNLLIGDWTKPDLRPGLPSGNAFTDLEGTWVMTWIYFLILVEHTMPQLIPLLQKESTAEAVIDKFLAGKQPIRLKDKSDDALLGWTDSAMLPKANALFEKMIAGEPVSPYMIVSYEHGGAFLGSVLLYPESGEHEKMVLVGNGNSLVINQFSPEYSVQSGVRDRSKTKRPFPGLAWETLPQVYGSCPAYGLIMDTTKRLWQEVFNESYDAYRNKMLEQDKYRLAEHIKRLEAKVSIPELTTIDREVLADPDKLQYKYVPSDVTPGVEQMLFKGVPLAQVEPFFRSIYRG